MSSNVSINQTYLRNAIQREYEEVATSPNNDFHFHVGRAAASRLGYHKDQLDGLPGQVIESFAGVGNPFALGELNTGEIVIDLGSGAGFDAILAAQQVGPQGRVTGIDMTTAMLEKARANATSLELGNIEFRQGYIEQLPFDDNSVDVIISNGVINLSPDKETVLAEAFRVLKPGGRMQNADIIVQKEVPDAAREDIDLWTG